MKKGNFRHKLSDILLLVVSAVLCGSNDWNEIELFGCEQKRWLRCVGDFKHGIPSHDTINRVFSRIDPEAFSACFSTWAKQMIERKRQANGRGQKKKSGEIVAIDGKRIRNSHSKDRRAIHMVSALAVNHKLCLGQVPTAEKSNEITAIPELLDLLDIKDCVVTLDAMGCQKDIAAKIRERKADYVLAVKKNQNNLYDSLEEFFPLWTAEKPHKTAYHKTVECNRGRIEERTCYVCNNLYRLAGFRQWKDIKSFALVQTQRKVKVEGEWVTQKEKRYYISSLKMNAKTMCNAIRHHWGVENNLHWQLDVTFKEDLSRKRKGYAPLNYNVILKFVLAILNMDEQNKRISLKRKRLKAALNPKYRRDILNL